MPQSVRVEFLRLGKGGNPNNIITEVVGSGITLAVGATATADASRPVVPDDSGNFGTSVRLVARENPVFVTWGEDPTATFENSVMLMPDIPEVIYIESDEMLSFIAELA